MKRNWLYACFILLLTNTIIAQQDIPFSWVTSDTITSSIDDKSLTEQVQEYTCQMKEEHREPATVVILLIDKASSTEEQLDIQDALIFFCQSDIVSASGAVILLTIKTSGSDISSIQQDACLIRHCLKESKAYTIKTVSYGSSGVVLKAASAMLSEKQVIIDHMFFIATPVIEENERMFRPKNYRILINFYSTGDWSQLIYNTSLATLYSSIGRKVRASASDSQRVYNIRTQINGTEKNGAYLIKKILLKLPQILALVHQYKYHDDLDLNMNISPHSDANIQLAIRHEKNYCDISQDMFAEIELSNQHKAVFEHQFGRDISYKASKFTQQNIGHLAKDMYNYFFKK